MRTGIVHLGIGAFHRAHQAVYTEDAIAAAGGDWGICGVTERSPAVVEQLAPQDGLYTLAQRGADGERLRVVGSVRELCSAQADPRRVLERIADPAIRVVTLTVSEKGYRHDPPPTGCVSTTRDRGRSSSCARGGRWSASSRSGSISAAAGPAPR